MLNDIPNFVWLDHVNIWFVSVNVTIQKYYQGSIILLVEQNVYILHSCVRLLYQSLLSKYLSDRNLYDPMLISGALDIKY